MDSRQLIIDGYKIGEFIARGEIGQVYHCKKGDKEFALKAMSKKKLRRQRVAIGSSFQVHEELEIDNESRSSVIYTNGLDKLMKEIEILQSLQHPNIVHLLDIIDDEEDEMIFLAFELLNWGATMTLFRNIEMEEGANGDLRGGNYVCNSRLLLSADTGGLMGESCALRLLRDLLTVGFFLLIIFIDC